MSLFPVRLETPRLIVREIEPDDWQAHRALDGDPEVTRYQSTDMTDAAGTRAYLARSMAEAREDPRRVFDLAVTLQESPALIGRVGLSIQRPEHRDAMIWFALKRSEWGRGVAGEAMRALLGLAFDRLGLHRVWGDCDPRNTGSARLMERLGMRREAHHRENWWLKGEWCDSFVYALLEGEWRAVRDR